MLRTAAARVIGPAHRHHGRLASLAGVAPWKILAGVGLGAGVASSNVMMATSNDPSRALNAAGRFVVSSSHLLPIITDWQGHMFRRWGMTEDERAADESATHRGIAARLRDLCLAQGGIYVKAGQHICAQPVLRYEYVDVLRVLMSHDTAHPFDDDDRATFAESTGLRAEVAFEDLAEEPVACASLAQVYRGRVRGSGQEVAVKIQHRQVAAHLQVDLFTIETYYALLSAIFRGLELDWLAAETRRHMTEELDFEAEARNSKRCLEMLRGQFSPDELRIPAVLAELSGPRVVTMEWAEGRRIDDPAAFDEAAFPGRRAAVARRVQRLFSSMIFQHGFVHCDPHPGNMLVAGDGALVLLDHGVYRDLSIEDRERYCQLWMAVLRGDRRGMETWTEALGVDKRLWRILAMSLVIAPGQVGAEGQTSLLSQHGEGAGPMMHMSKAERREWLRELNDLGVTIEDVTKMFDNLPKDLLLVLKANNLLRFINELLGSPVNRFLPIKEFAERGLKGRWGAGQGAGQGAGAVAGGRAALDSARAWVGMLAYPAMVRVSRALVWARQWWRQDRRLSEEQNPAT